VKFGTAVYRGYREYRPSLLVGLYMCVAPQFSTDKTDGKVCAHDFDYLGAAYNYSSIISL